MDPALIGVLGTLSGTALGFAGTFATQRAGQRYSHRESRRRNLQLALIEFFEATEDAQAACGEDAATRSKASARMWASFKKLAIVSSPSIREAGAGYCDRLNESLWQSLDEPAWQHALEANRRFFRAALEASDPVH